MINWPGNDYRDESILDRAPLAQARALQDAKRVSLGFLYWLGTDAPRADGGRGWPELSPRPDVFDTVDGLGKYPYVRECRRLRGLTTIREHPVEWNTGEAAGTLAAFTLETGRDAAAVHRDAALLRAFQRRLVAAGVPLYWFVDVPVDDPRFAEIQMAAVSGDIIGAPDSLEAAAVKRR